MPAPCAEPGAGAHGADLHDPGEHVGQRQEEQRRGVLVEEVVERLHRDRQLEHEVAVGEHAALGAPRGPGGVHQRRQRARTRRPSPLLELGVRDGDAARRQPVDGALVEAPEGPLDPGGGPALLHPGAVLGRLDDRDGRAGVAQDPADLLAGRGVVDRDGHGAGEPDRVVEEGPLVAGPRQQHDPVAGADAGGEQALGDAADLREELDGGDVVPAVVAPDGEDGRVGMVGAVGHHVVGEVARRGEPVRRRCRELTHLPTSSRAPWSRCDAGERTPRVSDTLARQCSGGRDPQRHG